MRTVQERALVFSVGMLVALFSYEGFYTRSNLFITMSFQWGEKNAFLKLWFDLEEFLNEIDMISRCIKHLFMGLYIHVAKI
jgi:hypothetical protein